MIAGQVPFPSPSLPEKLFAHQALEPTPLNQIVPDVPVELADVIRRMMRKQPEERYATPLQVAQALESFTEELVRAHDGNASSGVTGIDEPSQRSNGEPSMPPSAIESEEVSPRVLEPVPQYFDSLSSQQQSYPAAAAIRSQPPSSPVLSPMPDERQTTGLTPPLVSPINVDETGMPREHSSFSGPGP